MDFDSYKNQLPYPIKADFTTTYWYKAGKLVAEHHPGQAAIAHVSGLRLDECVKEIVPDEAAFKAARAAYGAETARLEAQFRTDLFEDLGISNHPLRDKLYSKAWEDGHANGYQEVYNCASNLTDLIEIPSGYVLVGPNCAVFGSAVLRKATDLVDQLAKELAK